MSKLSIDPKQVEDMREAHGLTRDEHAFYAALSANKSAMEVMGDNQPIQVTYVLLQRVNGNISIG